MFSLKSKKIKILIPLLIVLSTLTVVYLAWSPESKAVSPEDRELNEGWTLTVDGLVDRRLNLTLKDILEMPSTVVEAELWCVGDPEGINAYTANWTGVPLNHILDKAGASDEAIKVAFYAVDGFTTDLTLEEARRADVILAYKKDGKFLPDDGMIYPPLRLVVPGRWGYKWIKWVNRIELVNYDFKGYYESMGYED